MRVRTTILLLLVLAATAFVAGLVAMRRSEALKFAVSVQDGKTNWKNSVASFLRSDGDKLVTMVDELSHRQGAAAALLDNKKEWAEAAWDEKTLNSFEGNALWAYRLDGTLFYSVANTEPETLSALPVPADSIPRLFGRDKEVRFYFALPRGVKGGHRVMEVRGKAIRVSADENKTQTSQGFFFGGRIWDEESSIFPSNDQVTIADADAPDPADFSTSQMTYVDNWRDWQGRNVARFIVTSKSEALEKLEKSGDDLFLNLVLGALALFVILYGLLDYAIVHPLRRVIHALHEEEVGSLESMHSQKAEFGELSRLIRDFFEQQLTLTREMLERIGTEKALRQSEEMLRHSQKMEAVGRLAGGVAHDFNNLLTAIIGYADLLRQRYAHEPAACQSAELIRQAGDQAAGLTRQLLAFSRKQLLQPKIIDLNTIVTNLQRLLQRIIGEHIEIRTATDAAQPRVKADPGQVEQVIVNLGVNARDAMPRGGRLTIRTVNIPIGEAERTNDLPPGDYVALEVTDTGEGMDAETRARIFEPFFTTKGPGKGTGLGLATVYGIVRQSHGGIVVESERGRGSTFRILLPRVDAPVDVEEIAPVASGKVRGAETIMIVEDEDIVRELVCEILRSHGYRVLATGVGREAAEMARGAESGIDLLISDVVMPEMNGAEVAKSVREVIPGIRVLFVSGYSENDMADQGMESLAYQVLQKPFTPAMLAVKVREVLEGRGMKAEG